MHAAFLLLLPPPARSPPPAPLSPRAFSHRAPARPVLPRPCRPESTCLTALQPAAPRSLRCMVRFSATSAAVPRAYTLTPQAASGMPLSTEPYSWHYSFSTARSAFASRVRAPQSTRETGTRRGPPPLPPPHPPPAYIRGTVRSSPSGRGRGPAPSSDARALPIRAPSELRVYPTYILADSLVPKWSLSIVHCCMDYIASDPHTLTHTLAFMRHVHTRTMGPSPDDSPSSPRRERSERCQFSFEIRRRVRSLRIS